MRRFALPGLFALLALGVLAVLVFGVARSTIDSSLDAKLARGVHPLAPASGMMLPVLGGSGSEDLAALRGKVVVVNVFASWCIPDCSDEAPVLERTQKQLASRGGTVLGVTYQDAAPSSEQFVRTYGLTYPVVRDVGGSFARAYGATGVPETYIINRAGRVAAVRRYPVSRSWLDRTLAPLLAQRA